MGPASVGGLWGGGRRFRGPRVGSGLVLGGWGLQSACGEGAALDTWGWPGCGATLVDATCVLCVPLMSPCLPRLGLASSCL